MRGDERWPEHLTRTYPPGTPARAAESTNGLRFCSSGDAPSALACLHWPPPSVLLPLCRQRRATTPVTVPLRAQSTAVRGNSRSHAGNPTKHAHGHGLASEAGYVRASACAPDVPRAPGFAATHALATRTTTTTAQDDPPSLGNERSAHHLASRDKPNDC